MYLFHAAVKSLNTRFLIGASSRSILPASSSIVDLINQLIGTFPASGAANSNEDDLYEFG